MTDERTLEFAILRNDTLGVAMGGTTGTPVPFYPIALYDHDGAPVTSMVAAYAVHHGKSVNIADAYSQEGFDFSGTKSFDQKTGYRSRSFLTIPMKDHENAIIGVLQLLNAKDRATGTVRAFSDADLHLAESLASQAAIALTNRLLINRLEALFESFIRLINTAIDDKSPYTSGHCQRVPTLTMLLADAVDACKVGPLKGFTMSDRDRHELRIAGLLHDCGKITTPVHVVDKATKLQTLFDRIELIDTRFEVVKRDVELVLCRARAPARGRQRRGARRTRDPIRGPPCRNRRRPRVSAPLQRRRRIHASGRPGAGAADLGQYRWLDGNGNERPLLTDDEIENLTIPAGTLTREERRIINHHIDVTIQMLEALPWPRHLTRVPEYAGGHHERMDGRAIRAGSPASRCRCRRAAWGSPTSSRRSPRRTAPTRRARRCPIAAHSRQVQAEWAHRPRPLRRLHVAEGLSRLRGAVHGPEPDRCGRHVEGSRLHRSTGGLSAASCRRALHPLDQEFPMTSLTCADILAGRAPKDTPVTLKGWVRTRRDSKAGISFVHVSDGSCFHPVQVVAPNTLPNYADEVMHLTAGCAVEATGTIVPSPAKGQPFEMQATRSASSAGSRTPTPIRSSRSRTRSNSCAKSRTCGRGPTSSAR